MSDGRLGQADLLAQAFAVSAHLARRRQRTAIVQSFDVVHAHVQRRRATIRRYLECNASVKLTGLADLRLAASERGALFAVPQLGPFALAASLMAAKGMKVATVFWGLGGEAKQLIEKSEVNLLDLRQQESPLLTIRKIGKLRMRGYCVCLLTEVPMRSRKRYRFMGYDVTCSSLIEAVCHYSKSAARCLYCELDEANNVRLHVDNAVKGADITQALLSWAEDVALNNIEQYRWSKASIVFSDPAAYQNGLSFLSDTLAWRDKTAAGDRNPAAPG